jgi:hypothetical protein
MNLPDLSTLDTVHLVALAAAMGWASGIRLYAVLFITGLVGLMGWVQLPAGMQVLAHPVVLGASGFMLFVEFFADKIPGLDSLWDMVHGVIRIPAGAALAASVFGATDATMAMAAAILGGSLAAASYGAKATTRAAINTSPEPFSNIGMSFAEDALVAGGLWLAYRHPIVFTVGVAIFTVLAIWVTVHMFRYIKRLVTRVVRIFSGGDDPLRVDAPTSFISASRPGERPSAMPPPTRP